MYDLAVIWDWGAFSFRWPHLTTAMAWIGASFYFIALDLMLKPAPDMPEGATAKRGKSAAAAFTTPPSFLSHPTACPNT